jgi:hypothetical protein
MHRYHLARNEWQRGVGGQILFFARVSSVYDVFKWGHSCKEQDLTPAGPYRAADVVVSDGRLCFSNQAIR